METSTVSSSPIIAKPAVKNRTPKQIAAVRAAAVMSRWESVRAEKEKWLEPFHKLPLERALSYLDDLRKITEAAGFIVNARINDPNNAIFCETCKKDVSGRAPNGQVKWIAQKYIKNERNPQLGRNIHFCSELCHNKWVHGHMGAMGGDGK